MYCFEEKIEEKKCEALFYFLIKMPNYTYWTEKIILMIHYGYAWLILTFQGSPVRWINFVYKNVN